MQQADMDTQDPSEELQLWELVPLDDYALPQTPAARAAKARWVSLRRLFGGRREDVDAPAKEETDLHGLWAEQRDGLVMPIDWTDGAEALERRLTKADAGQSVCCVVGPPRSGHTDLLECWAERWVVRCIEPPAHEDILSGGRDWLDAWPVDAHRWVLPRLEHCWLRHPAGLALVRELLERASSGRLGRGVIGCDSWAWAYLRQVAALPSRAPLTLQAFDGLRLATLFRALVGPSSTRPVCFRNAVTGKAVLSIDGEQDGNGGSDLQYLAARTRGSVGLARELWRGRLRAEPHTDSDSGDAEAAKEEGPDAEGTTIWLAAPPEDPVLTSGRDDELALVLHALLLHNGLPDQVLAELLPLPRFRVQGVVERLTAAGALAEMPDGRRRVSAAGYAAARELLRAQGFLVDDF
jgi:hypothetical protein